MVFDWFVSRHIGRRIWFVFNISGKTCYAQKYLNNRWGLGGVGGGGVV